MKCDYSFFGISIILLFSSILICFHQMKDTSANDFYVTWAVGKYYELNDSKKLNNIYSSEMKNRINQKISNYAKETNQKSLFNSAMFWKNNLNISASPFLYFLINKMITENYSKDRVNYLIFSIIFFIIFFIIIALIIKSSISKSLILCSMCLMFYQPFLNSISKGNINCFLLAGVTIFHLAQKYNNSRLGAIIEGLLLSILLCIKPIFVFSFFLVMISKIFFKNKNIILFFCAVIFGASFVLITTSQMFHDIYIWKNWIDYLSQLDIKYWSESIQWSNFSFCSGVFYLTTFDCRPYIIFLSVLFIFYIFSYLRNKFKNQELPFIKKIYIFWLGFFIFQLVSPLFWYHYHVLNLLPLFILIENINNKNKIAKSLFLLLVFVIIWILIGDSYLIEMFIKTKTNLLFLFTTNVGVLLIYLFVVFDIYKINNKNHLSM